MDANLLALSGSTVQLKCPYKVTLSYNLRWYYSKEGSPPVPLSENNSINKLTLSPEVYKRLSVSGNHSTGEYHLNIADVRKSDEGKYECYVSKHFESMQLTVIGKYSVLLKHLSLNYIPCSFVIKYD